MPRHYLNQCWNIVNLTPRNKCLWKFNRNSYIFIQEIAFERSSVKWRPFCLDSNVLKPALHLNPGLWLYKNVHSNSLFAASQVKTLARVCPAPRLRILTTCGIQHHRIALWVKDRVSVKICYLIFHLKCPESFWRKIDIHWCVSFFEMFWRCSST